MKKNNSPILGVTLWDEDAETTVLGTILSIRETFTVVRELIHLEDFYSARNKEIFSAITSVADRGDRPDIITISAELKKHESKISPYDVAQIASQTTFDISQYVGRLNDLTTRRRFSDVGQYLMAAGSSEIEDIETVVAHMQEAASTIYGNAEKHTKTAADFMGEVVKRINENLNGTTVQGTPTGFKPIDSRGGFQPTNLILVAADSSQGKTSFANAIALNASKQGHKVAYFSLEMTGEQLVMRLTAIESNIPALHLANDVLKTNEVEQFDKAAKVISKLPLYFDDRSACSIDGIIASIRAMRAKYGIEGVIIDYLQIINITRRAGTNEENAIAEAARKLKNLAKELNIWVMALSQLNRNDQSPEPTVNRLRGSGQINEAADITILIYRPSVYNKTYSKPFENISPQDTALINVAKGRNIGTFQFLVGFSEPLTKFSEIQEPPKLTMSEIEAIQDLNW